MSPRPGAKLMLVRVVPEGADHVAAIGENRKLLVFPLVQVPEMARGQGVALQKYRDGGLSDAIAFKLADGLSWPMGGKSGRVRSETALTEWVGDRAQAGRLPPNGFPRDNKFA
jgi:topoisomerase-4 subunit A